MTTASLDCGDMSFEMRSQQDGMAFGGMATERRPARVFGSFTIVRPDMAVVRVPRS